MSRNKAWTNESAFYDALNVKLQASNPCGNTSFDSDIWLFDAPGVNRKYITIDFSIFKSPHLNFQNITTLEYDGANIQVNLSTLAKVIWLHMVEGLKNTAQKFLGTYTCLTLLFAYLKQERLRVLGPTVLEEFYTFCLTQNVNTESIQKRLSTPSYGNRIECFSIGKLRHILLRYNINGIVGAITQGRCSKALNKVTLEIMNMTAREYRQGGSFNFLGLEIGKHYIDHCNNRFEEYFSHTAAINNTLNTFGDKKLFQVFTKSSLRIKGIIAKILAGDSFFLGYVPSGDKIDKAKKIEKVIHKFFIEEFHKSCWLSHPFFIDNINKIAEVCKLPIRYDTQEFVRSLLFVDAFGKLEKSKEAIWKEFCASLTTERYQVKISLEEFEKLAKNIISESIPILPESAEKLREYLKRRAADINAEKRPESGKCTLAKLIASVSYAGTTCFIASTGWRASEFTFPLNSIEIVPNFDALDNHYTPWRFLVKWTVPKSHGETKLSREITLASYILAAQVRELRRLASSECIFPSPDISVREWWFDFVNNYILFNKSHIENTEALSVFKYSNLEAIHQRLEKELSVITMTLSRHGESYFMNRLKLLKEGKLDKKSEQIFVDNLSDSTLEFALRNLERLDKADIMAIRSELIGEASFPTPHAFRHIWAEAVYQRYRGDVGKFLRANFKHMDSHFFYTYLRDKDMKSISNVAQRHFINNVVRQNIGSFGQKKKEYAGGTNRFLEKVITLTKVITEEDKSHLAQKISDTRIVAAQENPWSTCFLRRGTEKIAKCSEDGVPQRHNASPKFCLDCINADISSGNFNGIVVYIKSDIDACREVSLPYELKLHSIETVRIAVKRVRELRHNSGNRKYDAFIAYAINSLELAERSR